jgi:hypothetical protein
MNLRATVWPRLMLAISVGLMVALAGWCASGTFLSHAYSWPLYVFVALIAAHAGQAARHITRGEAKP